MLESTKLQGRQSEIRQRMADLSAKDDPSEVETREMDTLHGEYKTNESRYRAALVAEDEERRDAGKDLENREAGEWDRLIGAYEVRQVALHLDEGRALDGATAEVVAELRNQGGYRGCPVPYEALEVRAGETTASGVPDPVTTRPIIDRLFPQSVAGAMGARMVNIASGANEYPVSTSTVEAGWANSEGGNVAGPTRYTTVDRPLVPDHTLGVQMRLTRKAMKQSSGIEDAVRRDMRGAIQAEMDRAVFQGAGANGEPLGVVSGAGSYGIDSTPVDAAATYAAFRAAITEFLIANAAAGPNAVRVLLRPETWNAMDDAIFDAGSGVTEFDRLAAKVASVMQSSNALAAPEGDPAAASALLTTGSGGVSPIFVATWGAVDMIRDPYSDAQSGGLRLTGLVTMDTTISRAEQLRVLTGLQ